MNEASSEIDANDKPKRKRGRPPKNRGQESGRTAKPSIKAAATKEQDQPRKPRQRLEVSSADFAKLRLGRG